jgi:kynurenine 3-monooxygenase
LEEARKIPGVSVFFGHKLSISDFDERTMIFHTGHSDFGEQMEKKISFDFCVGADGSHSNVRRQLMRVVR